MELLFGVQIDSEMVMPITLSGVNLKTKVETLKQEAAERWNLPKDSFGKHDFALIEKLSLLQSSLYSLFLKSKFNVRFFESVIFEIYIKIFKILIILNGLALFSIRNGLAWFSILRKDQL